MGNRLEPEFNVENLTYFLKNPDHFICKNRVTRRKKANKKRNHLKYFPAQKRRHAKNVICSQNQNSRHRSNPVKKKDI